MNTDYIKSLDEILKNDFTEQNLSNLEKRIDTGFALFNRKLGGGLYGGLTVLGAIPALGKTTFAIQLACNIAENSNMPVLYFSEEVPASRIAAKIISRNLYQNKKANKGVNSKNCLLNENELMSGANLHLWEKQKKNLKTSRAIYLL
uniref:DnaB-like helicase C-terminal domain-containing protein n=1 Tax=Eubacterium sp. TaxID=142586 RepID=UPI00402A43E8